MFATSVLSACSFGSHASGSAAMPPFPNEHRTEAGSNGEAKISHVVIVVQENRSFNNLFQGYPGAETARSGPTESGGESAGA